MTAVIDKRGNAAGYAAIFGIFLIVFGNVVLNPDSIYELRFREKLATANFVIGIGFLMFLVAFPIFLYKKYCVLRDKANVGQIIHGHNITASDYAVVATDHATLSNVHASRETYSLTNSHMVRIFDDIGRSLDKSDLDAAIKSEIKGKLASIHANPKDASSIDKFNSVVSTLKNSTSATKEIVDLVLKVYPFLI